MVWNRRMLRGSTISAQREHQFSMKGQGRVQSGVKASVEMVI
ncbi:hypothetical protein BNJ_00112 [Kaumoebavirus]|nr:hypothetical protein BNJ_00112 [Kaumoebavirus]ARA71947.1 hypothetical protein BNJ_00112 [Kaumoebavirus]